MTNIEAFEIARRKAVKGHNDWIVWPGKDGSWHAERRSPKAIKAAMLAAGTQGKWHLIAANSGHGHLYNWPIGLIMMRNAKYGC
jgi:hypothetical protein